MDRLSGSDEVRLALDRGDTPEQIVESWSAALKEYDRVRRKYFFTISNPSRSPPACTACPAAC